MTSQSTLPPQIAADLAAIASAAQPFTVRITGRRGEAGAGMIWQANGLILTNAHVIQSPSLQVQLADGRQFPATVRQRDSHRDLAVLQIPATNLPTLTWGDSDQVRVGEVVVAVGHPYGQPGAVTTGIIHATGTPSSPTRHWLHADIALAPGNSGGPLLNARCEVIGMNTMIVQGRGVAIASTAIAQWLERGQATAYLGVTVQPVQLGVARRASYGWLMTAIEAESPAAAAQLQVGDVIVGVRGQPFRRVPELPQILAQSQPGDGLPLTIRRNQQDMHVNVILCSKNSISTAA